MFQGTTAVNPSPQDGGSRIPRNIDSSEYDLILLDVDETLTFETIGTAPYSTRSCLRDANTGSLHNGTVFTTATACGHGHQLTAEPAAFTRYFLLIISGATLVQRERHKLPDNHSCNNNLVAIVASTWTTTGATATATTTSPQLTLGI